MSEPLPGLNRIAEALRTPIAQYAGIVRELASENARALTVFGSTAAGAFDPARHTVKSVLVLARMDLDLLRRLAEHGTRLGKARIAAPLVMTPDYIRGSADTFPLELIEIGQNHVVIFGDDDFADLKFDDADVRLQCEREFKSILIGLRQGLLGAAGQEKFISAVAFDLGERLIRILRGLLWLKGQKEGKPALQVIQEVETLADRKLPGVRGAVSSAAACEWSDFKALYLEVEALGDIADAWN